MLAALVVGSRRTWLCDSDIEASPQVRIPPTAVGGLFRSSLHVELYLLSVIPPTAVGGYFRSSLYDELNRQDLNNPPTPVGGIF